VNKDLFGEAKQFIAGGVNSPVRAFRGLGCDPVFIRRAKKQFLWGEDGRKYLDFCLSWGALILGHAPKNVLEAVRPALERGTSYGAPTVIETKLARLVCSMVPSIESVRFVSSGTEAAMSAIRLARGVTRRDKILKFDGCYHGQSDSLLVKGGSGLSGVPQASSAGIPGDIIRNTLSIPFNDPEALADAFRKHGKRLAAVIVEPVPANMGVVLPKPGYLNLLRDWTDRYGTLLIFDEVITGFRLAPGGAQEYFNIRPDLTLLGKIVGGGFPAAAFGGRRGIMKHLAPEGTVYQAGTLSGNPIAMTAGSATLDWLNQNRDVYGKMETLVDEFAKEWEAVSTLTLNHVGSMFTIFSTEQPVCNFEQARKQDAARFRRMFRGLLKRNIYLPPSNFETSFLSTQHTKSDLQRLLKACRDGGFSGFVAAG
jgi:glutamate-1-semialdehyde 2,1-aminomutase